MIEVYGARPFHPMVDAAAEALGMEADAVAELWIEHMTGPDMPFVLFKQDEQVMVGSLIPNGFETVTAMLIEHRRRKGHA